MKNDISDFHFRVVIKFREFLCLRYYGVSEENHRLSSYGSRWRRHLSQIVRGKKINKLFTSLTPERIEALTCKAVKLDPSYQPPNFFGYYSIGCDSGMEAKEIAESLAAQDIVEQTYIETHSASPPSVDAPRNPLSPHQQYLDPAPIGIDAQYAWNFPGGNGHGSVRFIDIEQGWIFDHEDTRVSRLSNTGWSHWQHEDHGTGVLGVILMQDNTVGGIGITPQANGFVVSQWRPDGTFNTADAIMAAIDHLDFGDIILLEAQTYDVLRTKKVWPVEAFDANFQAIRLATALGVAVVEAAGNSMNTMGNDLDLFRDGKEQSIFNRSSDHFKDSGAIFVAAGSSDVPHTRINYSNHGSRIDCFAWGENVVTAGSSPRSSGLATNKYSGRFSGTSSASAIIAGAAIAVQSIAEANYNFRFSPRQARDILSNELYGTNSVNGHKVDKIGVMPDLKKIIDQALNFIPLSNSKLLKTKNRRQTFATDSWL